MIAVKGLTNGVANVALKPRFTTCNGSFSDVSALDDDVRSYAMKKCPSVNDVKEHKFEEFSLCSESAL